jgi:uncharacterized membrane protein
MQARSAVTIRHPVEVVYGFWHDFSNLPSFMNHLESVEPSGDGRSHWTANGPAGTTVDWDAEIVEDVPNRRIAWRSLEGSKAQKSGSVSFTPAPGDRGTEVRVELSYDPPGGALGKVVAKLFGEEPQQQVSETCGASSRCWRPARWCCPRAARRAPGSWACSSSAPPSRSAEP